MNKKAANTLLLMMVFGMPILAQTTGPDTGSSGSAWIIRESYCHFQTDRPHSWHDDGTLVALTGRQGCGNHYGNNSLGVSEGREIGVCRIEGRVNSRLVWYSEVDCTNASCTISGQAMCTALTGGTRFHTYSLQCSNAGGMSLANGNQEGAYCRTADDRTSRQCECQGGGTSLNCTFCSNGQCNTTTYAGSQTNPALQ